MKSPENLLDRPSLSVLEAPAGQGFRDRIDVVDHAFLIGRDHAVADALQSDLRAFLFSEQRFFVELALGDVQLDADEAQQPAAVVDACLGAADDPAPLAGRMAHAMQTFEQRRLSGDVIANRGLNARHVVGMHERAPVGRLPRRHIVVSQHGFPARREVDAVIERIEIPQAVVRAVEREFVALLEVAQLRLYRNSLEARGKTAADELEQQMQLHVPVVARQRARDSEDAGRPILDEISDHENRADAELAPHGRIVSLVDTHVRGIAQFGHPQRREPRAKPGQRAQSLAAQLLRIAGRKHAARDRNVDEILGIELQLDVKGGIGAGRFAQQFQIRGDTSRGRSRGHRLEIDGDLGADDVETDRGTQTTARPGLRGQHV